MKTMRSRRATKKSIQKNQKIKIYKIVTFSVLGVLVVMLGFIITAGLLSGDQMSLAQAYALQTQKALNNTPTATPFQPMAGADEPIPTLAAHLTPQAGPTATLKAVQYPEGQINILLMGSDVRLNDGGFRTDVIVWVSLNPKDGFVSAVSFPRDLYVNIPGLGENRINTAFPYGGFELLADTFELNFGIRPDHYIMVDFSGFVSVINSLDGIDVQASQNLTDSCATWVNPSGTCSAGPGLVHMNGDMALWYARSRYSTSDIDRARRAQEVIEAIYHRLMSLDVLLMVPEVYDIYTTYVQTDITLGQILPLLPLASKINENGDIRNYVIGYDHVYDWVTPQGAQILVPDHALIQDLLIEALALQY